MTVSGIPATAIMCSTIMGADTIWATTTAVTGGIVGNAGIATIVVITMVMAAMTAEVMETAEATVEDMAMAAVTEIMQRPV